AFLSAAIAAGGAAMVASPSVLAAERDREEWIKYEDTPREVKRALDRERGNHEIKRIDHVFRNGREFYRANIDTEGEDGVVRVGEIGKLLSEEDVREVRTAGSTVRRGVEDDGERIAFDRLPGEVKTVIWREAGPDRVGNVYRYDRRGRSTYEAAINSSNG